MNKLARAITKWTRACDKRLARFISYIHHTSEFKQYCHAGNTAKQCRLGLFQDSDFAGDLEDSKSTSGMDGISALHLWNLVTDVFHSSPNQASKARDLAELQGNLLQSTTLNMRSQIPTKHINLDLTNIDHVSSNVKLSGSSAMLNVFEDNEAVIQMIIKGWSPTMRHVSRTHRVALDWLFDRINLDPKIQIRYNDTKHQLADILTGGNFT